MKTIDIATLKEMKNSEGLILQGCGGDLQEWVDGINNMLTDEGILLNGYQLSNICVFEYNGLTNLLFNLDNVKPNEIDMGKLAVWRIKTHEVFGGTWLSDYQDNQLGINEQNTNIQQIMY